MVFLSCCRSSFPFIGLRAPALAMANLSQCLDDLVPGGPTWPPRSGGAAALQDLYSEVHRLALEELIAGGREAFWAFLRKERVSGFLSEEEITDILASAALPAAGDEADQSLSASLDCSSVTYFPEQSDVEPPLLELGWPAFCTGSYRGVTRVDVHFQPSYGDGETIYSCKEAVRKLIRAAREVIAVVMDSFTDIDIFRDLQEACRKRNVPVYILLDQSLLPQFLKMCQNLGIFPEREKLMRVRTIAGNTYYTRSGAKIIGKVHEKFMLVDGLKVATGTYSFTWTDGKLNSSNMLVLSGQVVEHFDLQYRILYAQSKPINPKVLSSCKINAFDYMLNKTVPPKELTLGKFLRVDLAKLSSTPKKLEDGREPTDMKGAELERKGHLSDSSTIGEDDCLQNCDGAVSGPKEMTSTTTQTELWEEKAEIAVSDADTQTTVTVKAAGTQTSPEVKIAATQTTVSSKTTMTQTDQADKLQFSDHQNGPSNERALPSGRSATSSSMQSSSSSSSTSTISSSDSISSIRSDYLRSGYPKYYTLHQSDYTLRECFKKLNKERQYHYTAIRAKLDHMVTILSKRNRFDTYASSRVTKYNLKRRNEIHSSLLDLRDVVFFTPRR